MVRRSKRSFEQAVPQQSCGTRSYSYNGSRRMVIADFQPPDIKLDLFRGTTGTYAGLDRFARTIDQ